MMSPRAMPHARSVAASPTAPCAPTSSARLSVMATAVGSHASLMHFVDTAFRSCARVQTSGTSIRWVPSSPATRTRILMPIRTSLSTTLTRGETRGETRVPVVLEGVSLQ